MKTTSIRARALACALLATTAYCGLTAAPAHAQEASITPFPVRQYADENGVDLLSGAFTALSPGIRIGDEAGLAYIRQVRGGVYRDDMMGTINVSGSTYTVGLGGASEQFTLSGGVFTPVEQNGSMLSATGSGYSYTRADGTIATFIAGPSDFGNARGIVIQTLAYPSGRTLTYHYHDASYVNLSGQLKQGRRLQSVTSNNGWHIKLSYANDTASDPGTAVTWSRVSKAMGLNDLVDSCPASAFSCTASSPRPTLDIASPSGGMHDYTDSEGRTTRYALTGGGVAAIRLPGSASDDVTITYLSGKVSSVTKHGVTTSYAYSDTNGVRTVTVTRPGGATRVATFDIAKSLMKSDRDELLRTVTYDHDSNNRVTKITRPEGNYTQLSYDSRGNAIETRLRDKAGNSANDIVMTASFPLTCINVVTCNKPASTTDPRGNVTDLEYDPTHGGVTKVTAPAPTSGAVRPETRYSYARLDPNGAASASGMFRLTGVSACQTQASCAGTGDEVKATIAYGQNILPTSISSGAGDGSLTATSAMAHDAVGNLLSVDGPIAGSADTTRFRYNGNREQIGVVSPDPDGSGPLKHRAQRAVINAQAQVEKVETGTVLGQSDADWANFASLEAVETGYDGNRRLVTSKLTAGGTTYALTQTSYDALGRSECTAQRMNPNAFGSLPASACSLGTEGSFGPDRIVKSVYDAAGQVTQMRSAVGTTLEAPEVSSTYTNNGQVATVIDAENNKTTYEYDGHDRLAKTFYPSQAKGAGTSNLNDYEQLGYDAGSNVTSFRNRAAQTILFSYDALSRPTLKNLPGTEPDVSYGFDLLGRLTSASQPGHALSFSYDALGRQLSETGPHGTVSSAWDLGGRRTLLTYQDGYVANYTYLVTGEMKDIGEPSTDPFSGGRNVLATFGYDDLGRRTSLGRANGATTSYSYDPVSRLSQLVQNPAGTTHDLTLGFSYNPASQIVSNTRSRDVYAWTGHGSGTLNSPANGLNQLTGIGSGEVKHDLKGNATKDGTIGYTYGYSSENLLTSASGGSWTGTLKYDPLMRLYESGVNSKTRFAYDGHARIAEYSSSGAQTNRFIHGPGIDEPLIEYHGSGLATRGFNHADERGSIIASSNDAGSVTAVGRFDEYGKTQSFGSLRFGYAGQPYETMSELYYSRARMYNQRLPRFMQPDPIGYDDGMNMYAYVKGDPVNLVDPMGLAGVICQNVSVTTGTDRRAGQACYWLNDSVPETLPVFRAVRERAGGRAGRSHPNEEGKPCQASGRDTLIGAARFVGEGIELAGDVGQVVGLLVTFVAPPAGLVILGASRAASLGGFAIQAGANVADAQINGNYGGLRTQAGSALGQLAGFKGAAKFQNFFGRDKRGQFVKSPVNKNTQLQKQVAEVAGGQYGSTVANIGCGG